MRRALVLLGLVSLTPVAWGAEPVLGKASYYTTASCQREGTSGVWTANGERYDEQAFTAALPSHQFNMLYRVCRTDHYPSRKVRARPCVIVRHNDYGPGRGPRRKGVVIDLTPRAFAALAPLAHGLVEVSVERVR